MPTNPNNSNPTLVRPFDLDTEPRDVALAALTDEEFFTRYRHVDEQGLIDDRFGPELLRRSRALLVLARYYQLSYGEDIATAGGHPNPMRLELAARSDTTVGLAEAYRATWQWTIYRDDTALRTRPAIGLSEILTNAGITRGTWDGYVSRGQVPPRIGHDWHTGEPLWDRIAVEYWMTARRPGRRTDRITSSSPAP